MARSATVYDILIASPGDVSKERDVLRSAMHDWNVLHGRRSGCVLEPVMWETHSAPELGDRAQAIINRQIVDACDALIGVFWTRLGTPTGEASSGTVEEIERFGKAHKPVMLYFSSCPVDPNLVDIEQLTAVRNFKTLCMSRGLLDEYSDLVELRQKLSRGLEHVVDTLRGAAEVATRLSAAEQVEGPSVAEVRNLLKRVELSRGLRHMGHDDGKVTMEAFAEWYITNHERLEKHRAAWEALGHCATQLTKYHFTLGGGSTERFFEIAESVLQNAVSLLESGVTCPEIDGTEIKVLRCFYATKSRSQKKSVSEAAEELGMTPDDVRRSIAVLEPLGLVRAQRYFNARDDYEVPGSGVVCIAVHETDAA